MELKFLDFFKSPLIATPAVNPVTAGKNNPNRVAKLGDSIISEPTFNPFDEPRKMDPRESIINPKITYWILRAKISTDVSYYENN